MTAQDDLDRPQDGSDSAVLSTTVSKRKCVVQSKLSWYEEVFASKGQDDLDRPQDES